MPQTFRHNLRPVRAQSRAFPLLDGVTVLRQAFNNEWTIFHAMRISLPVGTSPKLLAEVREVS